MPKKMKSFLVSEREGALTVQHLLLIAFSVMMIVLIVNILQPAIVDKATEIAGWITDAGAH